MENFLQWTRANSGDVEHIWSKWLITFQSYYYIPIISATITTEFSINSHNVALGLEYVFLSSKFLFFVKTSIKVECY